MTVKKKLAGLSEIFKKGGGTMNIAIELGVTQAAVNVWSIQGIPRKHWRKLTKFYGITPDQLYEIDEKIRRKSA